MWAQDNGWDGMGWDGVWVQAGIRQLPVAADDAADLGEGVRGNVPERLDVLDVVDEELYWMQPLGDVAARHRANEHQKQNRRRLRLYTTFQKNGHRNVQTIQWPARRQYPVLLYIP
jgi:hypothetical protein